MHGARIIQSVLSFQAKVRTIAARKRRLRQSLQKCQALVHSGLWSLSEPSIARHLSVRTLPDSLVSTKTVERANFSQTNRRLRRSLNFLVPPYVTRIDRPIPSDPAPLLRNDYALMVVTKSGHEILIDRECTEVVRILGDSPVSDEWVETRRRLARHVSLPEITILRGGRLVKEPFAVGKTFVALDVRSRTSVADRLLLQFESLAMQDAEAGCDRFWRDALAAVKSLDFPADAVREINQLDERFLRQIEPLVFTPAHGDLSGSNIIVSNNEATLIDLEDCAMLPAFFDLYFLAHHEYLSGRSDVWRDIAGGKHGQKIGRILERFGIGSAPDNLAIWIWAMFLTECYVWPRKKGGQSLDRKRLTNWWGPIAKMINDLPRVGVSQKP